MDAAKDSAETAPRRRRPGGKPFIKGRSGNPHGRPKGSANRATLDAKEFCNQLVDSPTYRESLARRLEAGTAGSIEALVWAYAKGKPVDRVETGGPGAFNDVPNDELRRRLAEALTKL
jgi:hypothetical protein